jgi:SAM-dependent methyltransferase
MSTPASPSPDQQGPDQQAPDQATAEQQARRLAAAAIADGDPTSWFERLYARARDGDLVVPWDRHAPGRVLLEWVTDRQLSGAGRRAIVVGCGLGDDAELIASLGFDTTAFDISPSAVQAARARFPDSPVHYAAADLLDLPDDWLEQFDLVVESMTLQALPDPPRDLAIASVGKLTAPGGTLIVAARAREPEDPDVEGPPWALTRQEIDALAAPGLRPVRIADLRDSGPPYARRWRAEFTRPVQS